MHNQRAQRAAPFLFIGHDKLTLFALSLSKGPITRQCFDRLSPNDFMNFKFGR